MNETQELCFILLKMYWLLYVSFYKFIESKQIDTTFPIVSWGTVASLPHNSFMTNLRWVQLWVQHFNNKMNKMWLGGERSKWLRFYRLSHVGKWMGKSPLDDREELDLLYQRSEAQFICDFLGGWNIQARIRKQFNKLRCQNQNFLLKKDKFPLEDLEQKAAGTIMGKVSYICIRNAFYTTSDYFYYL